MNYSHKKLLLLLAFGVFCTQTYTQDADLNQALGALDLNTDPVVVFGGPEIKREVLKRLSTATTYQYAMYEDSGIGEEYAEKSLKKRTSVSDMSIYGDRRGRSTYLHHKVLLYSIDGESPWVGTGSCHWSDFTLKNEYEDSVFTQNKDLSNRYAELITHIADSKGQPAERGGYRPTNPEVTNTQYPTAYFSPKHICSPSIIKAVAQLINQERKSIRMAYECLSHKTIISALKKAQTNKYKVEVTILHDKEQLHQWKNGKERTNSTSLAPFIKNKCVYTNKAEQIHHKFAVFEENGNTSRQLVVTGSSNLSDNAETNNEDVVILEGWEIFNQYKKRFDGYITDDENITVVEPE